MLIFCELLNFVRVELPHLFLPESFSSASLSNGFRFYFSCAEKARLQAEAKAAEEARRQAEADAAAEARRKREVEREAARQALLKVNSVQMGSHLFLPRFLFWFSTEHFSGVCTDGKDR